MNDKEKCLVDISTPTGVSNSLTVLPITEFGLELSKQQCWDLIRLRNKMGKHAIYQHLVLVVVNLIFSIV